VVVSTRVVGIGGIFFKARDPVRLRAWYREHLGLAIQEWGGLQFEGQASSAGGRQASLVWTIFPESTRYFEPGSAPFMINYRVEDLDTVLDALRREGCTVDERTETSEFGRFGWVIDPEGNRLELWEPPKQHGE
jgi:predicted enzyme related to lactoylglutathione lyase